MPFPNNEFTRETIKKHFKKKKRGFDEDSFIEALKEQTNKYDVYWAVIGLRDVGTEKCIPYLKALKDYPMQDIKDCLLLTISHIVGAKETEFYISILQQKGTKKTYPLWAIRDSGDERAIKPVIDFLSSIYKKMKQPNVAFTDVHYIDGLAFLEKYINKEPDVQEIFDKFIEIKEKIPLGARETIEKDINYFIGKLLG